jgi:hypothetical protein
MVSAVRPGGWLMVEDNDVGGVMLPATAHHMEQPERAALFERVAGAVVVAGRDMVDFNYGAQLVRAFTDAGLVNIEAEVHSPIVAGEADKWIPGNLAGIAGRLVDTGLATASDVESCFAMYADPSFYHVPMFLVTAWGQQPAWSRQIPRSARHMKGTNPRLNSTF